MTTRLQLKEPPASTHLQTFTVNGIDAMRTKLQYPKISYRWKCITLPPTSMVTSFDRNCRSHRIDLGMGINQTSCDVEPIISTNLRGMSGIQTFCDIELGVNVISRNPITIPITPARDPMTP
mmetsp:Transcript_21932/g.35897  ORF Transcript_21932/g.35897 Transcript_21932/m.35897 type:complete len:122 (-) Transcript_21932:308-673(-)